MAEIEIHPGIRTMIPALRISNLTRLILGAPEGCLVECGVWRGGCLAVMASLAHDEGKGRMVHGFDSFEGLPELTPGDGGHGEELVGGCAATEHEVRETFRTWGVPMDHTVLHKGWFKDTVPVAAPSLGPIAVLRLDGDWYESTLTCLEHLDPLLVPGGAVVIDDYGTWRGCRRAVDEYRARHAIDAVMVATDQVGEIWWRK
jgi:hypothetical protein